MDGARKVREAASGRLLQADWDAAALWSRESRPVLDARWGARTQQEIDAVRSPWSLMFPEHQALCRAVPWPGSQVAPLWREDPDGPVCSFHLMDPGTEERLVGVCRPPTQIRLDMGRLHSTAGGAVQWGDGQALYFLRGIHVPPRLYQKWQSGQLEAHVVLGLRNAEVTSVLMEQLGWDSVVRNPRYEVTVLDVSERWGTLRRVSWRLDNSREERLAMVVEVINRSPEPDGTFRHYWLQVDRDCRPILRDGTFGRPQKLTSLNAVASTWGKTGEEYAMLPRERES
jgi:hypothetical protein